MKSEIEDMNKDEEILHLKDTIKRIITAIWLLFMAFSIGIISKYVLSWEWVQYVIEISLITFFAGIHFLRSKIKKKEKKDQEGGN